MEITFTYSREDYWHFVKFFARRRHDARQRVMLFSILTVCYAILFLMNKLRLVFTILFAPLLAAACVGLHYWIWRRRAKRIPAEFLGEHTIRIGPEGIFGRYPSGEVLNRWSRVTDIAEEDSHVFVCMGVSGAHIPKKTFQNPAALQDFMSSAISYWKSAKP